MSSEAVCEVLGNHKLPLNTRRRAPEAFTDTLRFPSSGVRNPDGLTLRDCGPIVVGGLLPTVVRPFPWFWK